jgi:hypothetical protein
MSILTSLETTTPAQTQQNEQYRQRLKGSFGCLFQTVAKGGDLQQRAAFLLASQSFLPGESRGPIHAHHIPAQLHDTKKLTRMLDEN